MKRLLVVLFLFLTAAFGQAVDSTPVFPSLPLPVGIAAFGEFNQLGTPRFTGGFAAIYPIKGSLGIYGTTTADILPKKTVDPASGKEYWGFTPSMRQGVHKDLFDTGRLSVLLGGDVGPSFGSGQAVAFSTSATVTPVYQLTPAVGIIMPIRGLYMNGAGWNPIVEFGVVINLSKLPKAKN